MQVLLISAGSLGDTLPFHAWAKVLKDRGHRVAMLGSGYYRSLFADTGIEFDEMWSEEQHREMLEATQFWQHSHAFDAWQRMLPQMIERAYQFVVDRNLPGETVVAAQGMYMGARIAQEKLGVPLATVHLQPLFMRSVYDPTGVPWWFPRLFVRGLDRVFDLLADKWGAGAVNDFRRSLGMPPVRRIFKYWCHSPELVLGFFPAFFSPPQRDWPPNTRLVGFPIPEFNADSFDSAELERFLAQGDPPLVFTVSSLTRDAAEFFQQSIMVATRLKRRALFLTSQAEQIPRDLPAGIHHFEFAPLSRLLPRSALHVHHAGSGSIGQTLLAGIPQITVPQGIDQGDLSQRLARLGVSVHIKPAQYKADHIIERTRYLLESPEVAQRCAKYAAISRGLSPLEDASDAVERLLADRIAAGQVASHLPN